MLEIGQPLMLFAAAGLLIPLAIHLWNRRPPRIISAGSIRWFRGSTSQSARSLQLKDLPLLLLRCLMLLVFCFLLAGLFLEEEGSGEERKMGLYLIEAEIASGKKQEWMDSLARQRKEARLLAPGLPPLADTLQWKGAQVDIWGVVQEADFRQDFGDTLWVHSPLRQRYFSGEKPKIYKKIIFEEVASPQQAQNVIVNRTRKENTLVLQEMNYSPERISFAKREVSLNEGEGKKAPVPENLSALLKEVNSEPAYPDTFFVVSQVSTRYEQDAKIIKQAFSVLDSQLPEISIHFQQEADLSKADLLLWFSEDSLPSEIIEGRMPVLSLLQKEAKGWKGAGKEWLIKPAAKSPLYFLKERPLPEQVEREELASLPLALLELLPAPVEEVYSGYLEMPLQQAQPYKVAGARTESTNELQSLHEWLWVLLVVLFMVERIWVNLK